MDPMIPAAMREGRSGSIRKGIQGQVLENALCLDEMEAGRIPALLFRHAGPSALA